MDILHLCTFKTPTLSAFMSDKGNCYHALEKCEGVKMSKTQKRFKKNGKKPSFFNFVTIMVIFLKKSEKTPYDKFFGFFSVHYVLY